MHKHNEKPVVPDPKGYESEDINLYPLFKWMTILLTFVAVSSVVTYVIVYKPFLGSKSATVGDVSRFSRERVLPSEPRLQAMPKVEMKDFRLMEKQKIEGYAWVDRQKGVVRIPVEKAMALVAERGASGFKVEASASPEPAPTSSPEPVKPVEEGTH